MEQKKTYFISDAHLGGLCVENSREQELRLVRWLDSIKHSASAIYLLGDMFDFWFEYEYVVPCGFTRFLGKLSELSDMGIELHFFTGNHDIWTFGYLEKEVGMTIHTHEIVTEVGGKRFFLAHGDGLGDPNKMFRFLRGVFHNKFLQRTFATLHPYIAMKFGLFWSGRSRKRKNNAPIHSYGEDEFLVQFAKNYTAQPIDYFVFGHRHIVLDLTLPTNARVLILGDWISIFSYAVYDGENIKIEYFKE